MMQVDVSASPQRDTPRAAGPPRAAFDYGRPAAGVTPIEYEPRCDNWDARWGLHYDIVGAYPDNIAELPLIRGRDALTGLR